MNMPRYAVGTLLAAGGLFVGAGTVGLVAAAMAVAVWIATTGAYAVAVGTLVVGLFATGSLVSLPAALIVLGLGAILALDHPTVDLVGVVALAVATVGALLAVAIGGSLAGVAGAVAVVLLTLAFVSYAIHRYEQVELGLVEAADGE